MKNRPVNHPITLAPPPSAGPCACEVRVLPPDLIFYPFLLVLLASVKETNKMNFTVSFCLLFCGYQKLKTNQGQLHLVSGGQRWSMWHVKAQMFLLYIQLKNFNLHSPVPKQSKKKNASFITLLFTCIVLS